MPKTRAQLHQLIQGFAAEAKPYIEGLGDPHPFIARLLQTLQWRPKDFKDFVVRKHDQFISSFVAADTAPPVYGDSRIEKLTHKIWLTAPEAPYHPPPDYVTAYLAMCKSQPADWTHFFWSNSAEVLSQFAALAIENGAKINAMNTGSLESSLKATLDRLIADRKFVLAADVMKFVVLDRYGGIYSDLGICFDEDMLQVAAAADYGFLFASNMFFQTSWISLAKESLLSSVFLGILNNPEVLSGEYALDQSKTVSAGTEVHAFAGLGYTVCALLFMSGNAKVFAFPQSTSHLLWRSQQSWYGETPKHGNVLINEAQPSVIQEQRYLTFAVDAERRLRTFNANGRLTEMTKIVIKLFDYFQTNETLLSKLLSYNGSDKVGAWHNYGYLYTFIFSIFVDRGCALMEIGDSRSLWGSADKPETGPAAGGSLRVWKEYLGAVTVGIEIDRSIGQDSSAPPAAIVNSASRSSLEEELAARRYDVIIDNGIHQFDSTTAVLEGAWPRLQSSGIYIIEALPLSDIERWEAYLSAAGLTGFLTFLPHASNRSDNCIIVLFNTSVSDTERPATHAFAFPTWTALQAVPQQSKPPRSLRATYNERLQSSPNVFRDAYSSSSDEVWKAVWLATEVRQNVAGIEFPAIPDAELQLQFHGSSSWEMSMTEAFDFYGFIKSKVDLSTADSSRFLDYGCGWGRMMRPFMRNFDLNRMFGFEPNLQLATIARSLNPYVTVLSGGYTPDGSIPRSWFDLVIGWSIFSHLSRTACQQWLEEIAQVLKPGGTAVFTTWGMRFLQRLQAEQRQMEDGKDIHWYSKMCIETAGDLMERITQLEKGDFVWFTNTESASYGEAFLSETALRQIINERQIPLQIILFDTSTLYQDVFIVRRG